jgi:NAD(P)H-hydrate epimerase
MKISTVEEMRELDREATEQFGISEDILMENAGEASYMVILKDIGIQGKNFVIFCGPGNNGGDGFVVARKLHSSGGQVAVFLLAEPGQYKGAAKTNLEILSKLPIEITQLRSSGPALVPITHCDAIVDAIFGTGLTRNIDGLHKEIIQFINEKGKKIYSLDIPSGINGDTGDVMGYAVRADYTVTYGLPKIGNIFHPGFDYCGKLYVSHISFPPAHYGRESIKTEINIAPPIPPRKQTGHKGDFGDVLFIAGSAAYFGAPYFSAFSFLKAGGGYSRLATPASVTPCIAMKGSEIVMLPQKETPEGSIALANKSALLEKANTVDMIVIGPGLSLNSETQELVREMVSEITVPLLIDGDGITAVASDTDLVKSRKGETILTPHPGEMSRITKMTIADIEKDRIGTLQKTCADLNSIIVLKGAHSLIGFPDGRVFVNMSGNPGMAKAGTGDVLNGVIAAMYGLGLSIPEAACKGVFIHGFAADLAARDRGEDGISAQDIMEYLPLAMKLERENKIPEEMRGVYIGCEVI